MSVKSTTDVMLALITLKEKYREGQKDLDKTYDRMLREEVCYCVRKCYRSM